MSVIGQGKGTDGLFTPETGVWGDFKQTGEEGLVMLEEKRKKNSRRTLLSGKLHGRLTNFYTTFVADGGNLTHRGPEDG